MIASEPITRIAPTVSAALALKRPLAATDRPLDDLSRRMDGADRVLMLVLDSWGDLNWREARERTPWLAEVDRTYRSATMAACLPSITPVNFASIGTGVPLAVHGVRTRDDLPKVPTLFEIGKEEGRSTAVVGPTAATAVNVLGTGAGHCLKASTKADSDAEVALMTASLLSERRPDLCLVQLLDLDTNGHIHGPMTTQHLETMGRTDRLLRHLVPLAQRLGYWTLITADHGMHTDPDPNAEERGTHGSDRPVDVLVPLWALPPA